MQLHFCHLLFSFLQLFDLNVGELNGFTDQKIFIFVFFNELIVFCTSQTRCSIFLLLLSASPYSGSPQCDSNLHFTRSTSSPSLAPNLSISSLTKSIYPLLGLPLFLLPATAISIILFPRSFFLYFYVSIPTSPCIPKFVSQLCNFRGPSHKSNPILD